MLERQPPRGLARIATPLGPLQVETEAGAVVAARFVVGDARAEPSPPCVVADRAALQLAEYFEGRRRAFDLPLRLAGTPFRRAVLRVVAGIPYGSTLSYADVARELGEDQAVRAVGAANGANPLAILVPCHRVVGSDGDLVGYAGGLARKRWLLEHERGQRPLPFS